MNWLIENPAQSLITLGIVLLIIEVVVMGFSTFILTFVGLSAIISGALIYFGVLPETLFSILISNAVLSSLLAALLWKPLKQFQNNESKQTVKNDLIGIEFVVTADIDANTPSQHRLSGVDWQVKSLEPISAGSSVVVEKADVGVLWVKAS